MDRKKIIITAVMINASLLIALFIATVTMEQEPMAHPSPLVSELKPHSIEIPTLIEEPLLSTHPAPVVFTLPPVIEEEPKMVEIAAAPALQTLPPIQLDAPSPDLEIEVQKGDTLEKIAKTYQTKVDELIKLNQLPSSFLKIGQRLKIPSEKTMITAKPKQVSIPPGQSPEYYIMKVGDNPWSIAMKHHIKVDELLKLNGLNEKTARKLKPGDRLRIQ
ncbi:MAG TPA: LysM peptidoglycan-binding domain-containing protein [Chlamydiales bacterium]|nr:LysM peptidoglycan-binding domain-containing protein [Chlamydiales bacterium]